MNTVGKILVILNFLFAVIVGAFLVVDFATRSNWQTEYKNLKAQHEVLRVDREVHIQEGLANATLVKTQEMQLKDSAQKLKDQDELANTVKIGLENRLVD
jgi:hypothetical protein